MRYESTMMAIPMLRLFVFFGLCLCSGLSTALQPMRSLYQIDMVVFSYESVPSGRDSDQSLIPLVQSRPDKAVLLRAFDGQPSLYHLLPVSASKLLQICRQLSQKPGYQILAHYVWLQSRDKQRPVILPQALRDGWEVKGSMNIRQSNYYLLNTDLIFSSPPPHHIKTVFSKKQRLKPDVVYYLDHPEIGILMKIHETG